MRSPRVLGLLFLSCCFLIGAVGPAEAAPGDVDRTFGQEGLVTFAGEPSTYALPEAMAVAPDGSINALRTIWRCSAVGCLLEHSVSRFRPNGGPDTAFGVAGTSAAFGSISGSRNTTNASMALGSDGRLVGAWTDQGQLILSRLNPDGGIDGSFGAGGSAKFDLGTPVRGVHVAVQSDRKIVVAAEPEGGYGGDAVIVARYTAQGALDPTFHGGVPFFTSLGSGSGGLALTGSNQLVLAGPRCCGADGRAVHATRLDENGNLDSSFGRHGEVFVDDVTDGVGVGAVVALPKGRIYVVGSGRGKGAAFALRLLPGGKLDRKFGNRGIAYMRHSFLEVAGAGVDDAGRLSVFGTSPSGTQRGPGFGSDVLTVGRRLSDGRPDPTFAGGSLVHLRSLGTAQLVAGGIQSGRMPVVLAWSGECIRTCPPPKTLLVRFLGGTSASRCQGKRATIVGTRHGEKLVGTRGPDVIAALAGNDLVFGRGGNDLICGGRGDDRLSGGRGRDVLRGGAGRNRLSR